MTRLVSMLAFDGAQVLDITGPLEVFARTSRWLHDHRGSEEPAYEIELMSIAGGPVRMSNGLEILAAPASIKPVDTLMVAGGVGAPDAADDPAVTDWLTVAAKQARRVAGVCT